MALRPQAGNFIATPEGLRDNERESRKAQLRLQLKARVRRFVEEFQTGFNGTRHPSAWSRKTKPRRQRP